MFSGKSPLPSHETTLKQQTAVLVTEVVANFLPPEHTHTHTQNKNKTVNS